MGPSSAPRLAEALAGRGRGRYGRTPAVSCRSSSFAGPKKPAEHPLKIRSRLPCCVAVVPARRKRCDGDPRRATASTVLPGDRLWPGVLDLPSLLPGPQILQSPLPAEDAHTTKAGRQTETPEKPGGTGRSPRPKPGLPGTPPAPARDGSYFRYPLRFGQYRPNGAFPLRKRTGKRLRGGPICRPPRN